MNFNQILFIILILKNINSKEVCPRMCTCDIFEGLKRADCSDANLATAYTNVAKSVEILNLSGNDIATIDNECLTSYMELKKLSLSRNAIHTIELYAFESLEKLNFLDLSDNRLEEFDNRLFERCEKLTILDLSKNKFMMLGDQPLIISQNLQFLSLRNSHLSHVYDSHFSELPNLIDLDISNNLLITLMSSTLESLHQLQFINLEYNRFSCDYNLEQTLQTLKEHKIHVKIDKCVRNSKKPMFEKMILHPEITTEVPRDDIDIDLVWGPEIPSVRKFNSDSSNSSKLKTTTFEVFRDYYHKIVNDNNDDSEEEEDCDEDEFFPSTCECRLNFINLYEFTQKAIKSQAASFESQIVAIFYFGIFSGAFFGYLIYFILSKIRQKLAKANKRQKDRENLRNQIIALENVRLVENSSRSSPMPAIRNRLTQEERTRSPMPTPRNLENRVTQGNYRNIPSITVHESPQVDRRHATENNVLRPVQRTSSTRVRVDESPTAKLIHKLFRNRDPSFLQGITPIQPLTQSQSSTSRLNNQIEEVEVVPRVIDDNQNLTPIVPQISDDNDTDSEYLSIENLSLDNLRSVTPPPAYSSILLIDENEK